MHIIKAVAFAAIVVACVIGSGIDETSSVQVAQATSASATMAQMGVTQ